MKDWLIYFSGFSYKPMHLSWIADLILMAGCCFIACKYWERDKRLAVFWFVLAGVRFAWALRG